MLFENARLESNRAYTNLYSIIVVPTVIFPENFKTKFSMRISSQRIQI